MVQFLVKIFTVHNKESYTCTYMYALSGVEFHENSYFENLIENPHGEKL